MTNDKSLLDEFADAVQVIKRGLEMRQQTWVPDNVARFAVEHGAKELMACLEKYKELQKK